MSRAPAAYRPEVDADGNNLRPPDGKDARWWRAAKGEAHESLFSTVKRLRERQSPRREMYRFYAELYGVNEVSGLGLANYDASNAQFVAPTLPFNVVRRGINTVVSKVAKNTPLPMVLGNRANYAESKRARGLTRFLEGAFRQIKVHEKTKRGARDACTFGTAPVYCYRVPGEKWPRLDRIFPWEILTDLADARYGEPRNLYVARWVDRQVLAEQFPDSAEKIADASSDALCIDDIPDYEEGQDVVLVTMAWHLGPAAGKPGRFVIAIDGVTLQDIPWTRDRFPFAFLRYVDPIIGMWGDSLAAEMSGYQYEINYVCETLRMAHRTAPTGIWLVPDGSDIVDAHFNNEVGQIIKHKMGFKPEHISPDPASPQTYQWLEKCVDGAYSGTGVSQMSAQAQKPAGITAAKALQTLDDIEADNFALFERAWEAFHVDIAELIIDEMREIAKDTDVTVRVPARRSVVEVNWKDVDMDRDVLVMQVFPVNLLGRTPAARLQQVNDLFNAGIIDRALYLKLLDAPDIDAETDLDAAMRTVCDEQIERMLEAEDPEADGVYQQPDTFQDLVYAMHRAQQHVCLGKMQGVPEGNLELLRQYIEDAKALLSPPAPPAPPAPPMDNTMAPGGAPGPMATIGVPPPPVAPPPPTIGGPLQ